MEYRITERGTELTVGNCFDLRNTFECGQCFRWNEDTDSPVCSYTGIAKNKQLRIYRDGGVIVLEGCSREDFENIWKDYFDTDTVYDDIRKEIVELCPSLECAVQSIDGIRILAQEPWEALCSFIISQNNNIPRIKGIVSRLCENFGEPCGSGYSFPSAETISKLTPDDLAPLRAGFRARYIIEAAQKVADGRVSLEKMYDAPIEDCRKELMTITGVGAKVAECTLLYGLHRLDAFPVDVWMKKALSTTFNGLDISSLGRYAGIAQQYIFHYTRNL